MVGQFTQIDSIILCGGLGTRLRSVVDDVPKCMAKVNNKPFIWYWLKKLEHIGCKHIIFSLGYKAKIIIDWIESIRDNFNLSIDYVVEEYPLGTGGGIRKAIQKSKNKDYCLILNGDSYFDVDLEDFYNKSQNSNSILSIALKPMTNFSRYGNVILNSNNIITKFEEKQFCSQGLINTGIYLINKNQIDLNTYPEQFSFERQVLQVFSPINGYIYNGYFIDIGIPEDYFKAQEDFKLLDSIY